MSEDNGNTPRPGFHIGGRFYPAPTSFRLGDPVLVTELTGMTWEEFIGKLDDEEEDPALMLGIVGVAVWQQHPTWKRDKAVAFVQAVQFDQIEAVGAEAEDDAGPPAESGEPTSTDSPPASTDSPASTLLTLRPPTSGAQASTTGAQA